MVQPIHEVFDRFGECFSHLWGFIIFGKSTLWASISCLLRNSNSPMKDVLFMYTKLINNTCKDNGSIFTCLASSLTIHLSIFLVHACENYLVARSASCDFLPSIRVVIFTW